MAAVFSPWVLPNWAATGRLTVMHMTRGSLTQVRASSDCQRKVPRSTISRGLSCESTQPHNSAVEAFHRSLKYLVRHILSLEHHCPTRLGMIVLAADTYSRLISNAGYQLRCDTLGPLRNIRHNCFHQPNKKDYGNGQ